MPYFEFPEGLSLGNTRDSRSVKVYARGKGPVGGLEFDMDNWGSGSQVTTTLVNPAGEVSVHETSSHSLVVYACALFNLVMQIKTKR